MPDQYLSKFGTMLKEWRGNLQQTELAAELTKILKKRGSRTTCSDSLISKFENGKGRPDPQLIDAIATYFKKADRTELVRLMCLSDYFECLPHASEERADLFWRYIIAGANRLALTNTTIEGFEEDVLRSFTTFIENHEVLDKQGQLGWQKSLRPKLEAFWVAIPDFRDDEDDLYPIVRDNIAAGANYIYFVKDDSRDRGRFNQYLRTLEKDFGKKGAEIVKERILAVRLSEEQEKVLPMDFVAADPYTERAIGFQAVRQEKTDTVFNLKLPDGILKSRIAQLELHACAVHGIDLPQLRPDRRVPVM